MSHLRLFRLGWLLSVLVCCFNSDAVVEATTKRDAIQKLSKAHQNAASFLQESIQHQSDGYYGDPDPTRIHRDYFKEQWDRRYKANWGPSRKPIRPETLGYYVRVGLAGGIGGATGTALLYPADCAKTLRQSNPTRYKSVADAFRNLIVTTSNGVSSSAPRQWHFARAYAGVIPATLGAIPSSALYFGAYESMKTFIKKRVPAAEDDGKNRLWIHALAAASGNIMSSAVFVPKETIKQQMQFYQAGSVGQVCVKLVQQKGFRGLYSGYCATLMRNIPSAMLRFVLYEELKFRWHTNQESSRNHSQFSWKLFAAGAVAGSLASGFMTPIDVMKTRLSTGTCPIDMPGCMNHIIAEQGWKGLYAGAGSRMLWSGAFASIGFGSFEAAKGWLGVSDRLIPTSPIPKTSPSAYTRRERQLQHALADVYKDK
jgi:solute carrier family 25 S-adenosylmethionine transporter 26